jgi:hypothetical protein
MAKFTRGKYQSNSGSVHPIRLSEERYAAAGTAPSGVVDSSIKVKVSKGNAEYGIRPRGLRLAKTETSGEVSNTSYAFLPILTQTAWTAFAENSEVTVDGEEWTIVSKVPEDF